jgi:hypothetical protein
VAGRGMSAAMLAEIAKGAVRLVYLVEIHLDSGVLRYTDGPTDLAWGGNTYASSADLVGIPDVQEDAAFRVGQVPLTLSGVAQANVATALSEPSTDRRVVVYRGCLDVAGALVPDPVVYHEGRIDGWEITEDPEDGTSSVEWSVASHWADFEKVAGRRTNDADHQVFYPGDRGFEFAPDTVRNIPWGRP